MNKVFLLSVLLITGGLSAEDLYRKESFSSLTEDKRAHRIGDTVTVVIFERTTAETSANTLSEREFSISGRAFDNTRENDLAVGVGKGTEGDAITRRNGFVAGTITALVTATTEYGLLKLEGVQTIVLNGEKQAIKLKGQIRKDDISSDNTVVSNRLTNAEIEFVGKGIVSDAQKPGWIARIFDWLGII
jgi:flagellar L-ring protein precursor FlgH